MTLVASPTLIVLFFIINFVCGFDFFFYLFPSLRFQLLLTD